MVPDAQQNHYQARAHQYPNGGEKSMSRLQAFAVASCVGLFGAALAPTLSADQWNKRTILTVNEAIQVPNQVLQPGKYVMKLLDSPSNRHIVQIFDENEQNLITTVLAIPNYRLQPTGETQFGFWETPAGQPKALRSWFYPGDNFGQEFAYPRNEAMQIAAAVKEPVPTTYAESEAEITTARVGTVDEAGTERELDRETYMAQNQPQEPAPATPQAVTPEPTPEPAPATPQPVTPQEMEADRAATPQELPTTASPYPMIGILGLAALAGFGVVSAFVKRSA
jgi:hypothetical protein